MAQIAKRTAKDQGAAAPALTRRNFIKLGLGALSTLAALEVGGAMLTFLSARSREGTFGQEIVAGEIDAFPAGSVTEFAEDRFFLVRAPDGGFLAVYRRCPHLGCSVHWQENEQKFLCPCHASTFDIYGSYDNAPVPRALDLFDVRFEDGQVVVDTTVAHRRDQFQTGQLAYA